MHQDFNANQQLQGSMPCGEKLTDEALAANCRRQAIVATILEASSPLAA